MLSALVFKFSALNEIVDIFFANVVGKFIDAEFLPD